MTEPRTAPYGAWKSPITSDLIVADSLRFGGIAIDGQDIYWVEERASDGGRNVVVRRAHNGTTQDVTPQGFNARSRVHEYGGGAFVVHEGTVYFSNFEDQQCYRQAANGMPERLTASAGMRYADCAVDPWRRRLIVIREDHSDPTREPINSIVSIGMDGANEHVLVEGNDFYAAPRLSPDGRQLAWLTWNHPNMPWDGCELWLAALTNEGEIGKAERVAGGAIESIFQPTWSPTGLLYFVSDRSGWWNIYRRQGETDEAVCPMEAEFGLPQWVFDMTTFGFVSHRQLACTCIRNGTHQLLLIELDGGAQRPIATPYITLDGLKAGDGFVVLDAGSVAEPHAIVRLDIATGHAEILRRASSMRIDAGYISTAEHIEFPTAGGLSAFGYYYPPTNRDFAGPSYEKPPLLVNIHGGPTAAASSSFDPLIQYWTSRGVAILDVDYGGSTGYGTAYRRRLNGQWGIVDVEDCVRGAKYLVDRGLVDGKRLAISGGSAGGYTTLCALTFHDTFSAGASYYGVSDVEALATDTHKFESRYCDTMIGPYPARRDLYVERSPINHVDGLSTPLIFFQGLEDRVVPPAQAESMFEAVRAKGLPIAYLAFPGEQHGFRIAANIKRALDAEFYFYARVFGYTPADEIEPVDIVNLP